MVEENDTLNNLCLQIFHRKVSSSTACVHPRSLPPTSAAAHYHSLRVYHQVQVWFGADLPAEGWGWVIQGNTMTPVATDQPPAPSSLLESVNCEAGCTTRRCGCRKYVLGCSLACGGCKGLHCANTTIEELDETDKNTAP